MEITELGAIGELVGGVAVIATLIYLAIQVRQGTKQAAASSMIDVIGSFNRNHELVLASREHATLLAKLRSSEALDPAEEEQAAAYAASLMNTWHGAQTAHDLGFMSRDLFETMCWDVEMILGKRPGLLRFAQEILEDYPQRKALRVFRAILPPGPQARA
ncbi:MAG: hypothetical protein HKP27_07195 [Myxococcales bacterium]|nr:hypothetical protein [Myxococcales bacterium]